MYITESGRIYYGIKRIIKNKRYEYFIAEHQYKNEDWSVKMHSARDAALAYDKRLIQTGGEPVNILRRLKPNEMPSSLKQ